MLTKFRDDEVLIKLTPKRTKGGSPTQNGSRFIGLTKNGRKWQVLTMIDKKKTYIVTYDDEVSGAKAYDKMNIYLNGLSAKTNFDYRKRDVLQILNKHSIEHVLTK